MLSNSSFCLYDARTQACMHACLAITDSYGCPEQVEHDLAWVRLLTGLHSTRARSEVNEIVSGIVEMGAALQFTEDKLTNIMEAAQVILISQ